MNDLWQLLIHQRSIDLSQPLHRGMPVSPNHPPFQMALLRRHGDLLRPDGGSAANELIITGGHVGTHIDALAHVSHDGLIHGGSEAASIQSNLGMAEFGVETVDPILCRGVLLDVAALQGVGTVAAGYEITPNDLEDAAAEAEVEVRAGDAVLIRTGWASMWANTDQFVGLEEGTPGPGADAAEWLAERNPHVVGGETIAFEVIHPGAGHAVLPAHHTLLVQAGIHIIEVMNLTALAATGSFEFAFVAVPLRIVGATGSPIRPLALMDD